MTRRGESPSVTPTEERVRASFTLAAQNVVPILELLDSERKKELRPFKEAALNNGAVMRFGSSTYEEDMKNAGQNAWQRPFGIDMGTLSPNIRLVLNPSMVFLPDKWEEKEAKKEGVLLKKDGPQAMIYLLDGFEHETGKSILLAANFLFMSTMIVSLLNGKYPLQEGERSAEFLDIVHETFGKIASYINSLSQEQKEQLPTWVLDLTDEVVREQGIRDFILYHTEAIKTPGLIETERGIYIAPGEAVERKEEYLKLSSRRLPKRPTGEKGVPSLPWVEYATNRYNRDHQLFGRYESTLNSSMLRVDYKLDTTHFPARYGFFHAIEIIEILSNGDVEHVILGQEVGHLFNPNSVFPIIVAGDFDFRKPKVREALDRLAADPETKQEVARVLMDVFKLVEAGKLERVAYKKDEEEK